MQWAEHLRGDALPCIGLRSGPGTVGTTGAITLSAAGPDAGVRPIKYHGIGRDEASAKDAKRDRFAIAVNGRLMVR